MLRPLETEVCEVEQQIGRRLILRGVKTPDRTFRGRISSRPGYLLLEYRDDTAGYFWDYDIIKKLLALVRQGHRDLVLYDRDTLLAQSPENLPNEVEH